MLGPSGSGKSTLARSLVGLLPDARGGRWTGRLEVSGFDPRRTGPGALTGHCGLLFQDPGSQLVMERVEDEVAFGLENRAWPRPAMRRRVPEALAEVGLLDHARRRADRLSGGEQQRLALAGVMAPRPRLLVLDEPTASLDPAGADALIERLTALHASRTTTIILIEHDVDRVWPLADQVLALGPDGRPLWAGSPGALDPQRDRLARAGIWLPGDRLRPVSLAAARDAPASDRSGQGRPTLELESVCFAYQPDRPVLRGVDLRLAAAERATVMGGNGSGKTTLALLSAGLLRPTAGAVRLTGAAPDRLSSDELARRVGFVFQNPEHGFVAERVADEAFAGLEHAERRAAADLLERLGLPLTTFGERSPYRLSGGEQRRLSLATALSRRRPLLVLDEPSYGQDRHGYGALLGILAEQLHHGTAVLTATHDRTLEADLGGRRLAVSEGRLGG